MKFWTMLCWCSLIWAVNGLAADMTVPRDVVAGSGVSIETTGSGDATAVLIGPGHIVQKKVLLGKPFEWTGDDLADAGRYLVILTAGDGEVSKSFTVSSRKPAHLSFVAHPSRAPVAQRNEITGTVYIFDAFNNLITLPMTLDFRLSGVKAGTLQRQIVSQNGVAAVSMDSPRTEGQLTFEVTVGNVQATRVVRVVADEPCTLRIHASPGRTGIKVQTDPVKDCAGNPVPDGTLVTFTEWNAQGRTTVDASVKKGIASVDLPASGEVRISAASGIALGNEIRLRAAQ